MRLNFDTLELRNFMSFENGLINLSDNGYVVVKGLNNNPTDNSASNGSGKSTIFEAISWVLTGETIRGSKEVQRKGSDGQLCSVKLHFSCDGTEYELTRTKTPSNMKLLVDGKDMSGKGIRDTEKILESYFPDLNSGLINSVILLGQGLPARFTNNTPSGRKDVLEKLSKSDFMIENIRTKVAMRQSELSAESRVKEDERLKISTQISMTENLLKNNSEQLKSLNLFNVDEKRKSINLLSEEIAEDEKSLNLLSEEKNRLKSETDEKLNSLQGRQSELVNLSMEIRAKQTEEETPVTQQMTELSQKIYALKHKISEYESVKDTCPTCGQKLIGVHKMDTSELHKELDEKNFSYTALQSEKNEISELYRKRMEDEVTREQNRIKSEIFTVKAEGDTAVRKTEESIKSLNFLIGNKKIESVKISEEINSHDSKVQTFTEMIKSNEETLEQLKEKLLYIDTEYNKLQSHIEVVGKFMTAIKRDFRGYLLLNVISFIDKASKSYSETLFGTDKLDFVLEGNNIAIKYSDKEYESLSGGERQKVDLCVQFALRDMLSQFLNFSCNILVLDEITDNLDNIGCQKVIDLISTRLDDIKSIFIISHRTDLNIPCDSVLTVEKDEQGISRCTMV